MKRHTEQSHSQEKFQPQIWCLLGEALYSESAHLCAAFVAARHLCFTLLCCPVWGRWTDSVALWSVKQMLELFLRGGLFLLHEISVALGDTPAIRSRQGRTQGTTRGWLQVLPVPTAGSEWNKTTKRLYLIFTRAQETIFQVWSFIFMAFKSLLTWLWPRAWCAFPDRHPSCHVSLMQLGGSPSLGPAPLQQPWYGKAQTHSSHR